MKKMMFMAACVAAFTCACSPKVDDAKDKKKDETQDSRKPNSLQHSRPQPANGGCCEAEKVQAPQESQTAAVEKSQ